MDAVTYPQEEVVRAVNGSFIPLRFPYDRKPYSSDFNVRWTPTVVVLDAEGKEHHRTVGYLPPGEIIASLALGAAKCDFDLGRYVEARSLFDRVVSELPATDFVPEAVYYRGVSGYKHSGKPAPLKEAYQILARDYAESEWAKRAYPFRLL